MGGGIVAGPTRALFSDAERSCRPATDIDLGMLLGGFIFDIFGD